MLRTCCLCAAAVLGLLCHGQIWATTIFTEDFDDGVANGFTPILGEWECLDGAYFCHVEGPEQPGISAFGTRGVHQEYLMPVAEEFGVGHAAYWYDGSGNFRKMDGFETVRYGSSLPSQPPMIVRSYRAWAIYDVSHFSPGIQVRELAVVNYLYPSVDHGHITVYGHLAEDPRPASAATCWVILQGDVYAEVETPMSEGEMTTVLGELAHADFKSAVTGDGFFMIRIEGSGDTDDNVWAKGWQEGMPQLMVVYEDFVPAEGATWGSVKALYR